MGIFLLLLVFSSFQTAAFAQSSAGRPEVFPRIEPDSRALNFYRPGNHAYSWTELAEISLWASTDAPASDAAATNLEQIRKIAGEISPQLPATGREKAEFILNYMHRNILKSYSINQTRIDTMLLGGR